LSNSWRSSAAITGEVKQLTIIDSHFFLAMSNLDLKIFESSLEVEIRTF